MFIFERYGFRIKVIPVLDNGELDLETFKALVSDKTRLVSVTHVSNVLGTVNPVSEIIREAHSHGIPVAVDGAQSVLIGWRIVADKSVQLPTGSATMKSAPASVNDAMAFAKPGK